MSLLNLVQGQRVYTQQIQHDLSTSNVMVNCDPRLKGPEGSVIDVKSRAGKIGVEDDICDLTLNNLTVTGTLTAKFDGSNLDGGTNYSDYLFYDNASKCFAVGSDQVHLGKNALAAQTTPNLPPTQAEDTIAIGNGALEKATGVFSGNKEVSRAIAIGKNAMNEITGTTGATHTENIAIGAAAMEKVNGQKNAGNIAIGARAMQNPTNAVFGHAEGCIAIGFEAMRDFSNINPAINDSIAIGYQALNQVKDNAARVIAIGSLAASVDCEEDSIAIGHNAGRDGLGQHSIAIGTNAARSTAANKNTTLTLNASTTILEPAQTGSWHVATRTRSANGGLLENTPDPAATIQKPTGTFTHYLVYSPTTGEIQMCPV